ncbi:DUF2478 domain-containing protein [Bradyrhizobium mercantei]|uniref:DUF2478 domain-containing protein n=1 Tax=Bradyrhizobium mercantei TaxID=1904807 RepID=UPI0009759CB5|nr:DUF2478 domain-containing protein [Bradyrhizobium mercantei]
MSVTLSARTPEVVPPRTPSLAAIVYPQNKYPAAAFEALVASCRRSRLSLAGVLQHLVDAASERRCDVLLEDLSTGHRTSIYEDRGAGASGCRLDESALAEVAAQIEGCLADAPDVLVLNKFGKAECGGGGLLDLIAKAMERNITVVIGVPQNNLAAWRGFAGDFGTELSTDTSEIERWVKVLRELAVPRSG